MVDKERLEGRAPHARASGQAAALVRATLPTTPGALRRVARAAPRPLARLLRRQPHVDALTIAECGMRGAPSPVRAPRPWAQETTPAPNCELAPAPSVSHYPRGRDWRDAGNNTDRAARHTRTRRVSPNACVCG